MKVVPVNPWLLVGRTLVGVYAVVIVAISIAGTALFPAYAQAHVTEFTPNSSWTVAQVQGGLAQLGWPATVPAFVELARYILMLGVSIPVGLLLLWRRPASWYTLYLAFVFISLSLGEVLFNPILTYLPGIIVLGKFLGSSAWQFFFIALYFFPNGQAVPRWTHWIAFIWFGLIAYSLVFGEIPALNGTGIYFALPIGAILSQIYRYFWQSNPLERQQTKWVFAAVVLMLAFIALIASWGFNAPSGPDYRASLVIAFATLFLFSAMFALFPLAVAVAIFRYHLWDIDLVIRRTLQYGLLTVLLGLVYFGSVVLLQQVFRVLSGQSSPLVVVLSTLVIVALFTPLRRRLQAVIDRRFFRQKYNAEQAVATFAAVARNETALHAITGQMVSVVEETVQPEQVWVWLKDGSKKL